MKQLVYPHPADSRRAARHMPRTRIERLARYFGTTPEFWLGLQRRFDPEKARAMFANDIEAIRPREAV